MPSRCQALLLGGVSVVVLIVLPARATSWERTYAAKTQTELNEAYAAWAPTYDEDSIGRFGYAAPVATADLLSRHLRLRRDARTRA